MKSQGILIWIMSGNPVGRILLNYPSIISKYVPYLQHMKSCFRFKLKFIDIFASNDVKKII